MGSAWCDRPRYCNVCSCWDLNMRTCVLPTLNRSLIGAAMIVLACDKQSAEFTVALSRSECEKNVCTVQMQAHCAVYIKGSFNLCDAARTKPLKSLCSCVNGEGTNICTHSCAWRKTVENAGSNGGRKTKTTTLQGKEHYAAVSPCFFGVDFYSVLYFGEERKEGVLIWKMQIPLNMSECLK